MDGEVKVGVGAVHALSTAIAKQEDKIRKIDDGNDDDGNPPPMSMVV